MHNNHKLNNYFKKATKIKGWTLATILGLSFTITSFTKLSKDEPENAAPSELKIESSTLKNE